MKKGNNMRSKMKNISQEIRDTYTGTFERFGHKNGYKGPVETVLLLDIKNSKGDIISDHLWFNKTKGLSALELQKGMVVQFNAKVKEYTKGYFGYDFMKQLDNPPQQDYKLSHPTKIKILDSI